MSSCSIFIRLNTWVPKSRVKFTNWIRLTYWSKWIFNIPLTGRTFKTVIPISYKRNILFRTREEPDDGIAITCFINSWLPYSIINVWFSFTTICGFCCFNNFTDIICYFTFLHVFYCFLWKYQWGSLIYQCFDAPTDIISSLILIFPS